MTPSPIKLTDPGEWLKGQKATPPTDPGEWLASQNKAAPTPHDEDPGFWNTIGDAVKNGPKAFMDFVTGHPIQQMSKHGKELGDASKEAWKNGDKSRAVGLALASLIPGSGDEALASGEEIGSGHYGAGAAHAVIALAPFARGAAEPLTAGLEHGVRTAATATKGAAEGFTDSIAKAPESAPGKMAGGAVGATTGHTVAGWPGAAVGGYVGKEIGGKVPAIPNAVRAAVDRAAVRLQQERLAAGPERVPIYEKTAPVPNQPVQIIPQVEPPAQPSWVQRAQSRPPAPPPPDPRVPIWQQQPVMPNEPVPMTPQAQPPALTPWAERAQLRQQAVDAKQSALAKDAATIPPDVIAELTKDSEVPVQQPVGEGEPVPNSPTVQRPMPGQPSQPPPATQPTLKTRVSQPVPSVDHSETILRLKQARTPAEQGEIMGLPPNATPEQIAVRLRDMMQESGTLPPQVQASSPAIAPTPAAIAPSMQDLPAATRNAAGKSAYRAEKGGDLPEGSGANTIIAANRANKVQPVVEAVRKEGIRYVDLAQLPAAQLKAHVNALAEAKGQTVFSDASLQELMGELKRAEGKPNPPGKPARRAQAKAAK